MIGIYKITNLLNQKVYIGQSIDIEQRWKKHCLTKDTCAIHKAIQKYGKENFSFEILEECREEELNDKEIYYINKYNSYINGYNMTLGGEGASHPVKLSDKEVLQIKEFLSQTQIPIKEIAKKFSVSDNTISSINLGKSRRQDDESYPIRKNIFESQIPDKDALLNKLLETKGNFSQIAQTYNVHEVTVRNWCKKYDFSTQRKDYGYIDKQEYHSHSVICYNKNGEKIGEYDSLRKAAVAIGKNSPSGLSKALRENRKEYAGYLWELK